MIQEDYVSFEVAKLLKEKGFREWCFKCYGLAVLYNGADISFDEECELKDEGRESEIEYVEGGRLYDYGCNNRDKDAKVWAAPTLWVAMKWLRDVHNYDISICLDSYVESYDNQYYILIRRRKDKYENISPCEQVYFDTYEEACEAAIKYCLKNLI